MKYDKAKLHEINNAVIAKIRALKAQHSFDPYLPLYASYLYATVAHARGHIHMHYWNKFAPMQGTAEDLAGKVKAGWGLSALGMKIENLEDQTKFLGICKLDLEKMQKYNGNLQHLPLEFPTLPEPTVAQPVHETAAPTPPKEGTNG